jgi:hypothetical protein
VIQHTYLDKLYVARLENHEDGSGGTAPAAVVLASAGDFANLPANTVVLDLFKYSVYATEQKNAPIRPIHKANGIEFFFCGGSAAAKTFGYRIIAWKNENGMARHLATGTGELGTQAVVKYPHNGATATNKFWADTLTVTWSNWLKPVKSTDTEGHNTAASVWTDDCGYRYWKIEITDADGSTGTEAGNVAVYWSFF